MINQNKSDGKAASGKRNSKKRYTYRRPVKKGAPRQKAGGVCSYCIFRRYE